jgi:hypothetical protein
MIKLLSILLASGSLILAGCKSEKNDVLEDHANYGQVEENADGTVTITVPDE